MAAKPKTVNNEDEAEDERDEEYEVKDIIDQYMQRRLSMFRIRWKGYTETDDTWKAECTLLHFLLNVHSVLPYSDVNSLKKHNFMQLK